MRPLFWNIVLCFAACVGCVVVALLSQSAAEDKPTEGFQLGVDFNRPILVREAEATEPDRSLLQEGDADLLAESLKHRINPNDLWSLGRPVQVNDRPPPKAKITTAE
jgi:hypothetical protein